jgi:hypothetical protein
MDESLVAWLLPASHQPLPDYDLWPAVVLDMIEGKKK